MGYSSMNYDYEKDVLSNSASDTCTSSRKKDSFLMYMLGRRQLKYTVDLIHMMSCRLKMHDFLIV